MGGAEAEVPLVPICQSQQLRAIHLPATGLKPQVGWLHDRHQEFQPFDRIHFLAHDAFDLADNPEAQRQPAIEARRQRSYHSGAQHELMADDFRAGWHFLHGD